MADVAPAPRHPAPTPVEANTYAPYAVLAVIALVVAIVYAVLLGTLAFMAFRSGQPFVQPLMLVFPVATLVLAFAARRQILNADGARAGMQLVTVAWWIAVLGGLGYLSYLVAYQLGVRQDAANSFRAWADHLNQVNLADPKDPAFFHVFDGTLDPDQQGRIKVGQAELLFRQRKPQVVAIRQTFIVRLANRNRGAMDVNVGGLDNWDQDASGQKGQLGVTVKCPEGEFAFNIPMTARRVEGQWKWQIGLGSSGNVSWARFTRYGQQIRDMEVAGQSLVTDAFLPAVAARAENPDLFRLFAAPAKPNYPLMAQVQGRMAVSGGPAWAHPEPADYNERIGKFFEPVEKGDPVREADQRRGFVSAWRAGRVFPPGRYIRQNPDQQPIMYVAKDAVELFVPVELQTPGSENSGTAARGTVVLRCDDPAFIANLNDLRAAAGGDTLTDPSIAYPAPGSVPWRLVRIESDMKPVPVEREAMTAPVGPGGG